MPDESRVEIGRLHICPKCVYYKTCAEPCEPINAFLRTGKNYSYELHGAGHIVLHPFSAGKSGFFFSEIAESMNPDDCRKLQQGIVKSIYDQGLVPESIRARVFGLYFFHRMTPKEIACHESMTLENVKGCLSHALKRVKQISLALDMKDATYNALHKSNKYRSLSPEWQWLILNKVCGFSIAEISKLYEETKSAVTISCNIRKLFDGLTGHQRSVLVGAAGRSAIQRRRRTH